MSIEDNKQIAGRWFAEFRGPDFNPDVIDELAHPDIRFAYSLHQLVRGRAAVRRFATHFTDTTVIRVQDGLITEEIGLDDGVTVLQQLGLIPQS